MWKSFGDRPYSASSRRKLLGSPHKSISTFKANKFISPEKDLTSTTVHTPQIAKMTSKLSGVSAVLSNISQEIDEKFKEKELLLDITSKLRHEIIRVKEDIQKLRKEQQIHYSNSTKALQRFGKQVESTKDIGKGVDAYKKSVISLGEQVDKLAGQNEGFKQEAEREKELVSELRRMIKQMKTEIASQKQECDHIRRNIIVSGKKCEMLKQKYEKMGMDVDQFYHVAKSSGVC